MENFRTLHDSKCREHKEFHDNGERGKRGEDKEIPSGGRMIWCQHNMTTWLSVSNSNSCECLSLYIYSVTVP